MKKLSSLSVLSFFLLLTGCSIGNSPSDYKAKNFDSDKIVKLYSSRVGISPPAELLKLWDKNWDERKRYRFQFWGDFEVLYPDNILKETVNAPSNYHRVDLSNAYWFAQDEGRMTRRAYDSLVRLMDRDPLLLTQDVRKWYLKDWGKHLKIAFAVTIAVPVNNDYSGRLFYGFDAAKKLMGIYYYPDITTEWPIYMCANLEELEQMSNVRIDDLNEYIESNAHQAISLHKPADEIAEFYKTSYKKVFGDSLYVNNEKGEWTWKIFKNSRQFEVKVSDSYYDMYQVINTFLNLNANHFRRPEFFSYCRLANDYVAVLSQEQIIDFSKKGILMIEFHTQPIEVFVPPDKSLPRTPSLKEFQELDEESKRQFLEDFSE